MMLSRAQGGGRSAEGGERQGEQWNPTVDGVPQDVEFRGKIKFRGNGFWRGAGSRRGWAVTQEIEWGHGRGNFGNEEGECEAKWEAGSGMNANELAQPEIEDEGRGDGVNSFVRQGVKAREVEGEDEGRRRSGVGKPAGEQEETGMAAERERVGDALEKFSRERDDRWKVKFEERGW